MADEVEKKHKKKATLIKHNKSEIIGGSSNKDNLENEKKKVVIVKRVVKVKKSNFKTAKSDITAPRVSSEKSFTEKKDIKISKPGFLGKSPREISPFERYKKKQRTDITGVSAKPADTLNKQRSSDGFRSDRKPGGYQERFPKYKTGPAKTGQQGFKKSESYDNARSSRVNKPFINKSSAHIVSNKNAPKRMTSNGNRVGAPRTSPIDDIKENKPIGKKFFRTKKRTNYQHKRQEYKEKILQVKKKTTICINPVPKDISILETVTVSELAKKMNLKASELISKLMSMGVMATINQQIDSETAALIADEYNCKVNIVSLYDETVIEEEKDKEEERMPRPPIVTVMGHVDHGKTKLLDAIRATNVVDSEHGGITQHIGAYTVNLPHGKIVFLDTPGHEAFTSMRARGAKITDMVILVVAANDGVMPQTIEAINHAKAAKVPIVVAINKIDLEDANVEKVKKQLAEYDLLPEEWGGHTLYQEISALKKIGIDKLMEGMLLQAEMLEIKANYNCRASGHVLESKVDLGRGIVATILVERGTLKTGDSFIAGIYPGKIRALFNDKGEKIDDATPSIPVEILGLTGLPNAGDPFHVTESERSARQIALKRQELKKMEDAGDVTKITLDNLYDQIKQCEIKELKVIVKGDVHGSVEALKTALEKLSTDEIDLKVIHASAGAINDNDVLLAVASNAIIIGFHIRPTPSAMTIAEREKVDIRKYNVIYDAIEDMRAAMEGLLAPEIKEVSIGMAEVRDTFKVPKIGVIAGSYVNSGKIKRGAFAHLIRDGVEIYKGKISSLRRFKDDAKEVETGFECGIGIENFNDIKVDDRIEVFEIREYAKKLGESKASKKSKEKKEKKEDKVIKESKENKDNVGNQKEKD